MVSMGYDRDVDVNIFEAADDDAIVVQIDTGEGTGRLRINLNEAAVWDGDPEKMCSPLFPVLRQLEALEAAAMQQALDVGSLRQKVADEIRRMGMDPA